MKRNHERNIMKIKTQDLTGPALDWAVAKCKGIATDKWGVAWVPMRNQEHFNERFAPSTNWLQGGPIIEREGISVVPFDDYRWEARCAVAVQRTPARFVERRGPTPLVAAMRCYVASRLGDEVEIPEELK